MTGITMPGLSGVRGHLAPSTAVFDDFDSPHTSRRPGSGRTLAEATGSLSRRASFRPNKWQQVQRRVRQAAEHPDIL